MNTRSMSWALTTAAKADIALIKKAQNLANIYQCPYLPRKTYSLEEMQEIYNHKFILVLDRNNRLFLSEPYLTWHPGMSLPRIRNFKTDKTDPLLQAMAIEPGDHIIDCTLGIGSDALIAAWATGPTGKVLGLEASPVIAIITDWGLRHQSYKYECEKVPIQQIASRIQVKHCFSLDFLIEQPDHSWDILYFDPMFKSAIKTSASMNSMRPVACYQEMDKVLLLEALRVCRKKVVIKERSFSKLFANLDCPEVQKSKYGTIAYGIWKKN